MFPSGRAALYSMKPTHGLVSLDGIVPVCHVFDSAGPMAKSPYDLALLLDVLVGGKDGGTSYTEDISNSWTNISVATLDPEKWVLPPSMLKPIEVATVQIVSAVPVNWRKLDLRVPTHCP